METLQEVITLMRAMKKALKVPTPKRSPRKVDGPGKPLPKKYAKDAT